MCIQCCCHLFVPVISYCTAVSTVVPVAVCADALEQLERMAELHTDQVPQQLTTDGTAAVAAAGAAENLC